MEIDRGGRIATWLCVSLLVVLSLVPSYARPHTGIAGQSEHVIAYAGTGLIAALAYRRAIAATLGLGLLSCVLEVLQNFVPGRGPAFNDAVFSTLGAGAGALVAVAMLKGLGQRQIWKRRTWRDR